MGKGLTKDRPLPEDGGKDIEEYNRELAQLGNPSWLNVPWLFSECYLYRYVPPSRSTCSAGKGRMGRGGGREAQQGKTGAN